MLLLTLVVTVMTTDEIKISIIILSQMQQPQVEQGEQMCKNEGEIYNNQDEVYLLLWGCYSIIHRHQPSKRMMI